MSCPRCGTDTPSGAAFCATCGAPQSPQATGVAPGAPAPDITVGGFDAASLPAIAGATPRPHTQAVDVDVTRFTPPAAVVTAGVFATSTSAGGGAARQMQMLVAGQTLGTRYHIIRLLGVGGMGAVYHAWDA